MNSWYDLDWLLPLENKQLERLGGDNITLEMVQRLASNRFNDRQARKIVKAIRGKNTISGLVNVRLAVLTDCNLTFCKDMLTATGLRYGLMLDIMLVEYSDILAQVTDDNSELYRFEADFIVYAGFGALLHALVTDFRDAVDGENLLRQATNQLDDELRMTVETIGAKSEAQILIQTIPSTLPDLFGNADRFQAQAFGYEVDRLNIAIAKMGFPLIDIARLAARIGTYDWMDDAGYHWTKVPFAQQWSGSYCDVVVRRIAISRGRVKKCLILDLDDTLWGGVVGDEGVDGIVLGNNSAMGEVFLAGQRYYKMLANRGVLLAVCSKNDLSNALLPFEKHPEMILEKNDISCFVANWEPKPDNIRYISEALNLGLDSFVFLDNDPMERDLVRAMLPQVAVPQVSDHEPSLYPRTLEAAGYFETAGFTSTDLARMEDYKANVRRTEIRQTSTDIDGYLKALDMKFRLEPFAMVDEDRIVQLINRSNQFNLTTKRYTNMEVARVCQAEDRFGFTVRLTDRFADLGIIAILICNELLHGDRRCWEIDTWLMSCRVLGRRVEQATLFCLVKAAFEVDAACLVGRYIPTEKNGMVRDHYEKLGFAVSDAFGPCAGGESVWILDVQNYLDMPRREDTLPFSFL
uniref:HAD-superfamily phosphatase, subfamily IIIC/FkbH-like domain-containing protein n=1 Tax=Candidatus Kentrum sp. FW TaxID=2126338 RepID=A0A450TV29_9GAMM|nr:MAG: HAD-superfamily phosphatase, subfamily IIIC/FkbH-like domain-containing protein [Candidatus Kentron sp. FW]